MVPRSVAQIRQLAQTIFGTKQRRTILPSLPGGIIRGSVTRRFEECHEVLRSRLVAGLGSPF